MEITYRLKIKVGEHIFEAEGPPESVREQFQAFRELIASIPQVKVTNPQILTNLEPNRVEVAQENQNETVNESTLPRIMRVNTRTVSLTVRPKSLEDAIVLIMFGQKVLRQSDSVTGGEIIDGLRATGGLAFGRIDRLLEKIGKDGDIIVTGENRGKRYRMTNAGLAKARQIAMGLLAIVA